jgi:hypothetical protein
MEATTMPNISQYERGNFYSKENAEKVFWIKEALFVH